MRGQQQIPASREVVWAALNDPEILKVCIPGCQELTKSSDTEMSAIAVIKVGPVTARFQGAVTLSDLDPPNGYKITGEGHGGVAGFAKGTAVVRLEDVEGGTILHYDVDAQIGGKLSQLGGRLIDATAKKMSGLFFEKFAKEILARQSPQAASSLDTVAAAKPSSEGPSGAGTTVRHQPSATSAGIYSAASSAPVAEKPSALWSFIRLVAAVALVGAVAIVWLRYGGLLPSLVPAPETLASDGRAHTSPDFASAVQLIMAAAIGYLFGCRSTRS